MQGIKITFILLVSLNLYSLEKKRALEVIDEFENRMSSFALEAYEGRFKKFHINLDWNRKYSPTSPGASPFSNPISWTIGISLAGWLVKDHLNKNTLIFVLCHELGHHFYGLGDEEKADYFAGGECWKEYQIRLSVKEMKLVIKGINDFRFWYLTQHNYPLHFKTKMLVCREQIIWDAYNDAPFKSCNSF